MATGIESNLIPVSTELAASSATPAQAVVPGEKAVEGGAEFSETLQKAQSQKDAVKDAVKEALKEEAATQKKAVKAQDQKAAKLAKQAKEEKALAEGAKEAKLKGEITEKDAASIKAEKKPPTKAQLENSKKVEEVKAEMAKQKAEAEKKALEAQKVQMSPEQQAERARLQAAAEQKQAALDQTQKAARDERVTKVPASMLGKQNLDAGKINQVANAQTMSAQMQQPQVQTVLQPIIMPVAMPMVMMPSEVEVLEVEHPNMMPGENQAFDTRAAAAIALSRANVAQHPLLMNGSSQDFIQNRMITNKPHVMQSQSQMMGSNKREMSDMILGARNGAEKPSSKSILKDDTVAPGFILQNSMERLQNGQTITSQALQPVVNVNRPEEVASHVYGLATKGGGAVKVRINPEELGELTITVKNDKGKLNVHLEASSHEAKEILASASHELKAALTGSRFDVVGIEVSNSKSQSVQSLSQSADNSGFDSRQSWDQQSGNGNPNSAWDRYFAQADEFNEGRGQRHNPYRGQYEQYLAG